MDTISNLNSVNNADMPMNKFGVVLQHVKSMLCSRNFVEHEHTRMKMNRRCDALKTRAQINALLSLAVLVLPILVVVGVVAITNGAGT